VTASPGARVVAIIVVGKSLAALAIVPALRRPLPTALTVLAALAQIESSHSSSLVSE